MEYRETTDSGGGDGDRCRDIDAYLDGDDAAADLGAFEAHLPQCRRCRETIAAQRWIDQRLCDDAARAAEAAPAALRSTLTAVMHRQARARRTSWAWTSVAAAALALLAIGIAKHVERDRAATPPGGDQPVEQIAAARPDSQRLSDATEGAEISRKQATPSSRDASVAEGPSNSMAASVTPSTPSPGGGDAAAIRPAADFVGSGDLIAVPIASESPDVAIVQLYPTTDAQRLRRLAALAFDNP